LPHWATAMSEMMRSKQSCGTRPSMPTIHGSKYPSLCPRSLLLSLSRACQIKDRKPPNCT
jgi:hypothetical protein